MSMGYDQISRQPSDHVHKSMWTCAAVREDGGGMCYRTSTVAVQKHRQRFRDWYLDSYISSFRHGKCLYINLTLPIPGYTALCSNSVDFDMLSVCVCVLYLMIDFFLYHITQGLSEATLLYTFTCHFIRYRFNKMLIIPQWFWSILTW